MITGFDYGTSNCAMGIVREETGKTDSVDLLPLEQGRAFMPSTLYAVERELICESVGLHIPESGLQEEYIASRSNQLAQARRVRREEGLEPDDQSLFFGREAFEHYFALPEEGYFVKSPKSFLGATGLSSGNLHFIEDIVTAMMQSIKQKAELNLNETITHTVIGRPVNFQGLNAEKSNRQAIELLTSSARKAGFKSVEFLFEPIAAGLNFEAQLDRDKTVLVVDVGGGTTDCAMVRMGPGHRNKTLRNDDFIGHSGERVGGNDLDISLAGKNLMPLFGMLSPLKSGKSMPANTFWEAVSTNDVGAQARFNSLDTGLYLDQLKLDVVDPKQINRFIKLRQDKQNHHLVRSAELCKIGLSDESQFAVDLGYIEAGLNCEITRQELSEAVARPVAKMVQLMDETINQAGCQPDLVYVTGGAGQSPIIQKAIQQRLSSVDVLDGDHFGSVAAGLTVWAKRIFS